MEPYYECITCGAQYAQAPNTCTTFISVRWCIYHRQDHLIHADNHRCKNWLESVSRQQICGGTITWAVDKMLGNYRIEASKRNIAALSLG